LGNRIKPHLKLDTWTGGVAQGIECLLCKLEILSSKPRPRKTQEQKLDTLWIFVCFLFSLEFELRALLGRDSDHLSHTPNLFTLFFR
jgi:hypothetical protein